MKSLVSTFSPFLPLPPPLLQFPPLPHKYRLSPHLVTVTGTRNFQNMQHHETQTSESAQQVRNTATSYDISCTALTLLATFKRFFSAESAYFSIWNRNRSCCTNILPPPPFCIAKAGTSLWKMSSVLKTNGDHLQNYQFT